ncbi:Protein of unknown function [Pyronema omphalodes CBS 100304]|uniref:Uncharacterized protein n=1 Tax=Pyronema omphalodes (strain CBS 100304) TaxID=1076935 RepID=U4LEJ2_PYROM|nr:Protein of unknown function [Pyronema omphalodes CBS 100304]
MGLEANRGVPCAHCSSRIDQAHIDSSWVVDPSLSLTLSQIES